MALSPAIAAPLDQSSSLAQQSPASWRNDGSLVGGGAKSFAVLVSDPANAKVTNNQAVTITDKGTAGSDNHLTNCGPASAYPQYGTGGVWMNYPDMFNKNKQSMRNNGATDEEIGRIYNSINTIAAASLVDRRVVSPYSFHDWWRSGEGANRRLRFWQLSCRSPTATPVLVPLRLMMELETLA